MQRKMMSALVLCYRTETPAQVIDEVSISVFSAFQPVLLSSDIWSSNDFYPEDAFPWPSA